ncbi:hypothetical protein B0J13DRAFT_524193 [Dactylonectria estremocensis]|uniref:Uncharacterized protein n=1 Tax=Dactylonectria estremocensis TaxID=1079267 RepID=A0A9P9F1N3_9HYPO|nr:hypothetical protein B0J13DRAFT_524193 [Dactylonectria estremocensis]
MTVPARARRPLDGASFVPEAKGALDKRENTESWTTGPRAHGPPASAFSFKDMTRIWRKKGLQGSKPAPSEELREKPATSNTSQRPATPARTDAQSHKARRVTGSSMSDQRGLDAPPPLATKCPCPIILAKHSDSSPLVGCQLPGTVPFWVLVQCPASTVALSQGGFGCCCLRLRGVLSPDTASLPASTSAVPVSGAYLPLSSFAVFAASRPPAYPGPQTAAKGLPSADVPRPEASARYYHVAH